MSNGRADYAPKVGDPIKDMTNGGKVGECVHINGDTIHWRPPGGGCERFLPRSEVRPADAA
ncbi:hypothetical protein [Kitasatospora phosalacinea]|uniref:Uncharacterized protein n=1 Tax=Kitasatospora phosalacinea TaxID=2065 RepID=A0A9W6UNX4_9ACTN|nr:hypothetical protein [Kitasatospora phosalacinea]GLW53985.1 hypothetical protein Kpho01_19960 [Kitasatospora phosalacinea]